MYPKKGSAFVTNEILVRVPQVPLWYGWNNRPSHHPSNWQRENHQYGLGYLFYYLTEVKGVPRTTISGGFNAGTNLLPQEYYIKTIGLSSFRNHFLDWIGDMLNGFQFISKDQREWARLEWYYHADPGDDNRFIEEYTNSGTDGWIRTPDSLVTAAWAFNTFKINNSVRQTYTFKIDGDRFSNESDDSYFEGMIVVQSGLSGTTMYPLTATNAQESSLTIDLTHRDTTVYFVIASMPEVYEGAEKLFSYEVLIETGLATGVKSVHHDSKFELGSNPARNVTSIQLVSPATRDLNVQVFSLSGALVSSYELQKDEGELAILLDEYAAGTYLVHIDFGNFRQVKKLIVK